MKKNEFLHYVASRVLGQQPAWSLVWEHKRWYTLIIGRQLPNVFVYIDLQARSDRDLFGQGVGWAPNLDLVIAERLKPKTPELKSTYPRLSAIREHATTSDFEFESLRRNVGSLARPFTKYELADSTPEALCEVMQRDIEDFALPYLTLMLAARHRIQVTTDALTRLSHLPSEA